MANDYGTLSVPILAQRVLDYLHMFFPPVMKMYIGLTDQQVYLNQEVKTSIPIPGAAYTPDLTAENPYTAPEVDATPVSVTASTVIANSLNLTVADLSKTPRNLAEEYAPGVASELGVAIVKKFFEAIDSTNFTLEHEESAANYDDDTMRRLRKLAGLKRWPVIGRMGIINGDAFEALTGHQVLTDISAHKGSGELIEVGLDRVNLRGFELIEFPEFDLCKDAAETDLNGVFMSPGALVAALAVPMDSNLPGFSSSAPASVKAEIVTDPETGLSILSREHRKAGGGYQIDFAVIMGVSKGDANRLYRVIEAEEGYEE